MKFCLVARCDDDESVGDFYEVFGGNIRDLGAPMYSQKNPRYSCANLKVIFLFWLF